MEVIQTVREKFTCRECEKISQPPAPFHVTPRGFAGPNLLAMVLFEKFAQHQPLNRQSERYAREGVELSLSALADQVGACAVALKPVHALIEAHVLAADRLHADDTTVPILAKGKIDTGRIWTYVRDDRRSAGNRHRRRSTYASGDRRQEHPERHLRNFTGILQADAYGGYNPLFKVDRDPSPLTQALCWAHARRKFFVLADIAPMPSVARTPRRSHRSRSRRSNASTPCLVSSATSTESSPTNVCNDGRKAVFSPPNLRPGCGQSGQDCRAALRSPSQSTIC